MWVKQMGVDDWYTLFTEHPEAVSQVRLVEQRIIDELPLATWEQNCLKAYKQLLLQKAA